MVRKLWHTIVNTVTQMENESKVTQKLIIISLTQSIPV
jgi:hypothetical protein